MARNVLLKGFITGLILQAAIGPVFVFILNISLQYGLLNGLSAVLGVTVVDYLYIILAIAGVGKILEIKKIKRIFTVLSSAVLVVFGVLLLENGIQFSMNGSFSVKEATVISSFLSTFILTVSSPLTIVFWASIFTNKTIEYSLCKKELVFFGLAAGTATFIFLGITVSVFSYFNSVIPEIVFQILNIAVGLILTGYGIIRIKKELTPVSLKK